MKPMDSKTLKRQAYIAALEINGNRQIYGSYARSGGVCALGLLEQVLGIMDERDPGCNSFMACRELDDERLHGELMRWNDEKHIQFPDIANLLRRRWRMEA